MNSVSYALTLQASDGTSLSGTLTLALTDSRLQSASAPASPAALPKAGDQQCFEVIGLSGTLSVPDLIGPDPVACSGGVFVSPLGPPLTYLVQGARSTANISLQFNLIDSPGQYIGGGLGFFPQGFGTPIQPYGVTGVRQD